MKEHKLAAIVFTDIVGYTKRMEADEERTMELLARQRELVFPLVKEFGGEVIKEIGDGLMMMFTSANRAVRFAIAVQEKLLEEELTIRAGIHIGDVIFEKGDVFGSAVNIAARIEPLAPAGGICISEDVRSQIRNQSDIITTLVGKKELKGVKKSMEIFQIVKEADEIKGKRVPFLKDLWRRRVPQITLIYLLLAYILKIAMNYIVREYMLSPHLIDLVWVLFLSLIPSIILISYFHGRKGVSRWTKVELIGLPVNLVAAILLAVIIFKGKDLGAMTTTLTIQNEDGEKVEKTIVKTQYRKNILIYTLKNNTGDTAYDYLQYGIPSMVEQDLSQDMLFNPLSSMEIYSRIAGAGYKDAIGLPITLMQRFAEQRHMKYFMFGSFELNVNEIQLNIKIYESKLTRLLGEINLSGEDPFHLVDELSKEVKRIMGIPEAHISSTVDLPVSEIFTDSEKALYYFSLSRIENAQSNWSENARYLELALKEDPNFALAYMAIALSYFNIGNQDGASYALKKLKGLMHKLPERQQFTVKYVDYIIGQEQDPEKALNVLKMWVDLYPNDLQAHSNLALRYSLKNKLHEAIGQYHKILELDPEQYQVLSVLGRLYLQTGKKDSSLMYYEYYAEKLPRQATSYRNLGNYFIHTGDLEAAKENYEKALYLADVSEQVPIRIDLAEVHVLTGDFDNGLVQFNDALDASLNARDSAVVFQALELLYLSLGKVYKSLDAHEQLSMKQRSFMPPKDYLATRALNLEPYLNAGEFDRAVEILEEIALKLEPPLDKIISFGYMFIYAENGDIEKARESMKGAEELIKGFGQESLMVNIYYTDGKLNEQEGDYSAAKTQYLRFQEMVPTSHRVNVNLARCNRMLQDYDAAEKAILLSLEQSPYDPLANYEAALLYLEKGEREKGISYLKKAVDIWKDADPIYEPARLAKEKYLEY